MKSETAAAEHRGSVADAGKPMTRVLADHPQEHYGAMRYSDAVRRCVCAYD
jgi:hypothetical protein